MADTETEELHDGDRDVGRYGDRSAFARALAGSGYERVTVLSLDAAAAVLTERRRELVDALRTGEYESVRALARNLDRDKGAVSRDLSVLAEHGVTTLEEDGRAKRPVLREATIVVEPLTVNET